MPKKEKKKENNFYFGYDSFTLENNNVYIGGYCAHRNGVVWREGPGIYIAQSTETYEGTWENDQLSNEPVTITYKDNSTYRGTLSNGQYQSGIYEFCNNMSIKCSFCDNIPNNDIFLTDPNNFIWKGQSNRCEVFFKPINHFYQNLTDDNGIGKKISKNTSLPWSDNQALNSMSLAFQQCKKEKSVKSLKKKSLLIPVPEEQETNIISNKKISILNMAKPDLYSRYISDEHRNACKPIKVIYPSVDLENKN